MEPADAPVPMRVLVPEGAPRGVFVYYHGGGWVIGGDSTSSTRSAASSPSAPAAPSCSSTTASPPSTATRSPSTTRWAALEWVADHVDDIAGAPTSR